MKRMEEHEVLHLGQTIAAWRVIAQALRAFADEVQEGSREAELISLARSIEMHLPLEQRT